MQIEVYLRGTKVCKKLSIYLKHMPLPRGKARKNLETATTTARTGIISFIFTRLAIGNKLWDGSCQIKGWFQKTTGLTLNVSLGSAGFNLDIVSNAESRRGGELYRRFPLGMPVLILCPCLPALLLDILLAFIFFIWYRTFRNRIRWKSF